MRSPFDYQGFTGDGISDDTIPLQSALNDPTCNWLDMTGVALAKITAPLVLSRTKIITGLGPKTVINYVQAASGVPQAALRIVPGAEGSKITGLKVNYAWAAQSAVGPMVGVVSNECAGNTLDDITVDGCKASAPAGLRVSGLMLVVGNVLARRISTTGTSGYGIFGAGVSDVTLERCFATQVGDGYGIAIQNPGGAMYRVKVRDCLVDLGYEPASSAKVCILIGDMTNRYPTFDVEVEGCAIVGTAGAATSSNGSITLGNCVRGRVANCSVQNGGIGISIADGWANTVVGNALDMDSTVGYGIEISASEVVCTGNAIEGRLKLWKPIAVQSANAIYNVNVGPNMIQAPLPGNPPNRIYVQPGHPGPIRILDP